MNDENEIKIKMLLEMAGPLLERLVLAERAACAKAVDLKAESICDLINTGDSPAISPKFRDGQLDFAAMAIELILARSATATELLGQDKAESHDGT
jgi:hypothetical protein